MDAPPGIFKGSLDRFNGVTIDSDLEFNKEDNFAEKLESILIKLKNKYLFNSNKIL